MRLAADTLYKALETVNNPAGVRIGVETMGKLNQLGTIEEVIELCKLGGTLSPVVDFGHVNCRELGAAFKTKDDYRRVFDRIGETLGDSYARDLHCHFSKIEYTDKGEKKHLTFEDDKFGPPYEPFAEAVMVSSGSHWKGVKGLGIKDAQDTDTLTAQPFLCSGVL